MDKNNQNKSVNVRIMLHSNSSARQKCIEVHVDNIDLSDFKVVGLEIEYEPKEGCEGFCQELPIFSREDYEKIEKSIQTILDASIVNNNQKDALKTLIFDVILQRKRSARDDIEYMHKSLIDNPDAAQSESQYTLYSKY